MDLTREILEFVQTARRDHGEVKLNTTDFLHVHALYDRISTLTREFPFFLSVNGVSISGTPRVSFGFEMLRDRARTAEWSAIQNLATVASAGLLDRIRCCPGKLRKTCDGYFYAKRSDKFHCSKECAVSVRNSDEERKDERNKQKRADYYRTFDKEYRKGRRVLRRPRKKKIVRHSKRKGRLIPAAQSP